MAAPSTKNMRLKFLDLIKTIKPSNGYVTDLTNAQVLAAYDQSILDQTNDGDYPKCFIITDSGKRSRLVALQKERITNFIVVFVNIVVGTSTPELVAEMVEVFIDDLEKVIDSQDTLGGTVTSIEMTEFTTDAGFTYPRGVAVARVSVLEEIVNGQIA